MRAHFREVSLNQGEGILLRIAFIRFRRPIQGELRGDVHRSEKIARGQRRERGCQLEVGLLKEMT